MLQRRSTARLQISPPQVFYKKIIATKLWGGVMPMSFFPAYCGVVLLSAVAVQHLFLVRRLVACTAHAAAVLRVEWSQGLHAGSV